MRRSLIALGVVAVLAVTWSVGFVRGKEEQSEKKELILVSADEAKFKEVVPGVSKAVLWGDPDKRPYGAFTKFVPGFAAVAGRA